MENIYFIFVFIFMLVSYIALKVFMFRKARKEAEAQQESERPEYCSRGHPRQAYVISPVYTIEGSRGNTQIDSEPASYDNALHMPPPPRSEYYNKSFVSEEDGLPTYDQAMIYSKSTTVEAVATAPTAVDHIDETQSVARTTR